jgi:hypothetical protein
LHRQQLEHVHSDTVLLAHLLDSGDVAGAASLVRALFERVARQLAEYANKFDR